MARAAALTGAFFLIPLLAAAANEVRRVGIAANGRVQSNAQAGVGSWSQMSSRAKSQNGLSFWHALRKELESRRQRLGKNDGLRSDESRNSKSDALWKAVLEVDRRHKAKLPCRLREDISYAPHHQPMYSRMAVKSARECSLMCAADPLGERSGLHSPCQSFTYNSTSTECKFFSFGQPAKATWIQSPGSTSGPPCNLEGFRQEIQQAFETDLKQTVVTEKQLNQELETVHVRFAEQKKHTEQTAIALKKAQQDNSMLKSEIVRKQPKPADHAVDVPQPAASHAKPNTHAKEVGTRVQEKTAGAVAKTTLGQPVPTKDYAVSFDESAKNMLIGSGFLIGTLALAARVYNMREAWTANKKYEDAKTRNLACQQEAS